MILLNQILHPTDFSDASTKALEYARTLASRFDSELRLVHVHQPLATAGMVSPGAMLPPHFEKQEQEQLKAALDDIDVGDAVPADRVHRNLLVGTPFMEIVRCARDHSVDLIVIGTHGRSALQQVLLGSVAEKVVRKAPCPVLTVQPDGHQFVMP